MRRVVAASVVLVCGVAAAALGEEARSDAGLMADDIPVAKTPAGYWQEPPPPILAECVEPLSSDAVDMRGQWKAVEAKDAQGEPTDRFAGHVQRIEQCGNRVVVVAGGVTHDMRCDGTFENGVNDLGERAAGGRMISVKCNFEDGVHVLRPKHAPGMTVEREIVDGDLIWRYGPMFVIRLERIGNTS